MIEIEGARVVVTKADIRNGIRDSKTDCAIACAVKRVLGVSHVRVFDTDITVYGFGSYRLPEKCADFIQKYDHDLDVKPMVFRVGRRI